MRPAERTEKKSWIWKLFGTLLIVALCVGGIRLFVWFWNGRPEMTAQQDAAERADFNYTLRNISGKERPAIHLEQGYDYSESFRGQAQWTAVHGMAFAQGGFRLGNNQIVVPQTGLYFVYSQASFKVVCSHDIETGDVLVTHVNLEIWLYSFMYSDMSYPLMKDERSVCQHSPEDQSWFSGIYLGAVFQLRKGDRLAMKTSPFSALQRDQGKTFFGVFAL